MARLAAFLRKGHPHRKGRAVDAFLQRAEIVGDALRQHRHDAVGEIDGVATLQRLAVQRRTGPHIPGDIGNGDGDDDAVRIVGRRVGLGIDRIVMVLGVGRIDGYERQVAPVLAVRHAGRLGGIRLGKNVRGEDMRNAVGMDRDHRDRLFGGDRADDRQNLGARQAITTAVARGFHLDQIAILCIADAIGVDDHFLAAPVDRHKPSAAACRLLEYTEQRVLAAVDQLHDTGRIGRAGAFLGGEDLRQNTIAKTRCRGLLAAVLR
ncbi:hypothetical protein D3C72_1242190 [compost metagenome]